MVSRFMARQYAQGYPDYDGHDESGQSQLQGGGKRYEKQFSGFPPLRDGPAELAPDRLGHKVKVLDGQRLVQAQVLLQLLVFCVSLLRPQEIERGVSRQAHAQEDRQTEDPEGYYRLPYAD